MATKTDAERIAEYVEYGFFPDKLVAGRVLVSDWINAGFDYSEFIQWLNADAYYPDKVKQLIAMGFTPEQLTHAMDGNMWTNFTLAKAFCTANIGAHRLAAYAFYKNFIDIEHLQRILAGEDFGGR